ncbi:helix-turn-helix domain-containing protein [Schaalia suimastitidis]|uniref:helix-turn-helix domain-containing protein n=1 Tax=Schaalia suimastitidis TaxID=121163 RepID=UPI0003FC5329|nr:helix-turn-helix transcriptional regulator [Schaalia suimastitidis]
MDKNTFSLELRARRGALGLSQDDLARLLGVKQTAVSLWETGRRTPQDPVNIMMALAALEDTQDQIIDELCEQVEHASAVPDTPYPLARTYRCDADYWAADARAMQQGIPASLHRTAAAWAARIMREEQEKDLHQGT